MAHTGIADAQEVDEASLRLQVFDTRRGWQLGILVPAFVLTMFVTWIFSGLASIIDADVTSFNNDFRIFWGAARLAIVDTPLAAFDIDKLAEMHGVSDGRWMPWSYPPSYLVALMPLGMMSFPLAWGVFSVLSMLAIAAATRPFTKGHPQVWLAFAFAPAYLPPLFMGQNSLIWAAGLLAALAAIKDNRPVIAGVLIGLLTLKPQLGILIPIALIASGAWRTFVSASVTTIMLSVGATLIVGVEYWSELREMMEIHFSVIKSTSAVNDLMVSPFGILAGLGMQVSTALTIQWCFTAVAAATVAIAWRSPAVGFDLRAAVLIIAILLSTPYLWYYESALLAPAALFLLRAGVLKPNLLGLLLSAAMWLGLSPALLLVVFGFEPSFRYSFAPIVLLAFATCFWAVIHRLGAAGSTPDNLEEHP
ncbi:glycosyltransferase family 87 protein [Ruegeria arenilitoris]|uniref:glycosyltransferase family 87 protein n=1 Tax=Ruegeria arenilitoris TaxID=1173585 RepID=UPI00147A9B8E|nr:glycosyltransferase family 87 protein [Ruegeria arenilitoris]